ncbi:hypothetical protein [Sphingobium sp.]|uniref:hypothetical protein n=1 Tax=Sphingobium sp. TaxID=1912891 RepID=UPI0028BEB8C6|nr:hypothetical protein [Sphingobium sp.]
MAKEFDPGNLVIVGAGFSFSAGLPLAGGFTKELLSLGRVVADGPSARQIAFIKSFADQVFGEGASRNPDDWPDLEDIFTLVDLSANTGHHLGPHYSAADLRVVRRAIIVRMIRMLSQAYKRRQRSPDAGWRALETFFDGFRADISAVLSMNWDTVFERGMARAQTLRRVDYGCHARAVMFDGNNLIDRPLAGDTLHILKPHGSVNWLYCDACRETFWVPPSDTDQVAQTLFRRQDWAVLPKPKSKLPAIRTPACPHCDTQSLGTRFATFSYRKALDFPMHSASWRTAEQYLKGAADWVFIGYSMPAADFEFKHLLKRVQLTEGDRPNITVITGGRDADVTIDRYKKFFGDVKGKRFFFRNGLDAKALLHLKDIKVLRA